MNDETFKKYFSTGNPNYKIVRLCVNSFDYRVAVVPVKTPAIPIDLPRHIITFRHEDLDITGGEDAVISVIQDMISKKIEELEGPTMIWQTKCKDCGWIGDASECNGPGLNRCPKCGEDDLEDIEVEE